MCRMFPPSMAERANQFSWFDGLKDDRKQDMKEKKINRKFT